MTEHRESTILEDLYRKRFDEPTGPVLQQIKFALRIFQRAGYKAADNIPFLLMLESILEKGGQEESVHTKLLRLLQSGGSGDSGILTLPRFRRASNDLELRGWKTFLRDVPLTFLFYQNKYTTSNVTYRSLIFKLFIYERTHIAERRMASLPIIVNFEVFKKCPPGLLMGWVNPVAYALLFERSEETFHDCIIPTIAFA